MIELQPSGVRFISDTHQYFLGNKELFGITSTLVKRAFPDSYKRPECYSEEQWADILKNAAERGSNVHEVIELYEDLGAMTNMPELRNYIAIMDENHLEHIASEYVVTDGERYASAIDQVFVDENGGIVIGDVKTTYQKNYDKVACQLSIYKRFFERQNPELKVSKCALIWLRGDSYEYKELKPWSDDVIDDLINADKEDRVFDIAKNYGDLPAMVAAVEEEVARLEMVAKQAKEQQEKLRDGLYKVMVKYGQKSYKGEKIQLTVIEPTIKKSFDSKKFKEENEDLYKKYIKESKQEGYLKIKVL